MSLNGIHNIYFIGIGGIGMSAIARYFAVNGKKVAGFDKVETEISSKLTEIGIAIHYSDSIDLIPLEFRSPEDCLVVYQGVARHF